VIACLALLSLPRDAAATTGCDVPADLCQDSDRFVAFESTHERAAPEGPLAFRFQRGRGLLDDTEALSFVTVEITENGNPIAGELVLTDVLDGRALWIPDAPMTVGATVEASVTVDNDGVSPDGANQCNVQSDPSFVFEIGEEPGPLVVPDVDVDATYFTAEHRTLETLRCCDSSFPRENSCLEVVSDGSCASEVEIGYAAAEFQLREALPEALAARVALRLLADGEVVTALPAQAGHIGLSRPSRWAGQLELLDLVTGEAVTSEVHMVGADETRPIGEHEVDAAAKLECSSPYVCEIVTGDDGAQWDPTACEPMPESVEDSGSDDGEAGGFDSTETPEEGGCACRTTSDSPAWHWLFLAAPLALYRRRYDQRRRAAAS